MAVIYYQVFIVITLIATRLLLPKLLLIVALIWTGLTLFNLFFPPLIAIQLLVIWISYSLLRPRHIPTS
jgi:hypothetical protein